MTKTSLNIFRYTDYIKFLSDFFEEQKMLRPSFTHTKWALELKLKTSSSLTKVLKNQRSPGPEMIEKFVKYFGFDTHASFYFQALVLKEIHHDSVILSTLLLNYIKENFKRP